jgi:hypothetical protein
MNDTTKAKAEEILSRISTQTFDNFYKGLFEDYTVGVTGEKQHQEVLEEIAYIFHLND